MPHLHGAGPSVCWEVCANTVCVTRRTPDLWPGTAQQNGRTPWLLPLVCHLPALPLQLPVDHCQGEEEGPENHQGDTMGDAELRMAGVGGSKLWLG